MDEDTTLTSGTPIRFAAVFIAIAAVIIAPLAVIETPLLADYPNHVARMHMIGNVDGNSLLSER